MKISAAPPHRVSDLLRFLRQMGYAAEEVEYAVVEVEAGTLEAALALARHLSVWNAVNGGDARLVDAGETLET